MFLNETVPPPSVLGLNYDAFKKYITGMVTLLKSMLKEEPEGALVLVVAAAAAGG